MTNEIDVLEQTLSEYREAKRIKNMNQELLQHLGDSIFFLLKHSEKYNTPLPKKDELLRMMEKANSLIEQISEPINRKFTPRKSTDNLTEPFLIIFK